MGWLSRRGRSHNSSCFDSSIDRRDEIEETAFLTRFTSGWSAMPHVTNVDLETFKK
jgi:hypothetical protein